MAGLPVCLLSVSILEKSLEETDMNELLMMAFALEYFSWKAHVLQKVQPLLIFLDGQY